MGLLSLLGCGDRGGLKSLRKDLRLVASAEGGEDLTLATDGTLIVRKMISRYRPSADYGVAQTLWVDPVSDRRIADVEGWPIGNAPWPAPYIQTSGGGYAIVDGQTVVPIPMPPGAWTLRLAFPRQSTNEVGLVFTGEPSGSDAAWKTPLLLTVLTRPDWKLDRTAQLAVGGIMHFDFDPFNYGVVASPDGGQVYLGHYLRGATAATHRATVDAYSMDTLALQWSRPLPVKSESWPRRQAFVLAADADSVFVAAGISRSDRIGTDPHYWYKISRDGSLAIEADELDKPVSGNALEELYLVQGVVTMRVIGPSQLGVVAMLTTRDEPRATLDLRTVDLATRSSQQIYVLPSAHTRPGRRLTGAVADPARGVYWLAPDFVPGWADAGYLPKPPPTPPTATK